MQKITRRGLFKALAGAAVGAAVAPAVLAPPKPKLQLHPDAFSMVWGAPHSVRYGKNGRVDILWGAAPVRPELACRVGE